jgi:hypothetical protein
VLGQAEAADPGHLQSNQLRVAGCKLTLMRPLTEQEGQFLNLLLTQPLRGADELRGQVSHASVTGERECCPSLDLAVDRDRALRGPIDGRVHFEARGKTAEGTPFDLIIHHHDGYLTEFEVVHYNSDEAPRLALSDLKALELFGWDEDDPSSFPFRSKFG